MLVDMRFGGGEWCEVSLNPFFFLVALVNTSVLLPRIGNPYSPLGSITENAILQAEYQ